MNLFICKCRDEPKEEKNVLDLINIKNLENSIKRKEIRIIESNKLLEGNIDIEEQINNLEDELEIIDYPYVNKEEEKVKKNYSNIQKVKSSFVNKNNNIFNKRIEPKEIIKISDLNSSSLKDESLIIDNIEYLNDEDSLHVQQNMEKIELKSIQHQIKIVNSRPHNDKTQEKNNISFMKLTNLSTRDSNTKIINNEAKKSQTSIFKKKKKNSKADRSEKKECYLNKEKNKKSPLKYDDYIEFKNHLNKTFEEFSKNNRRNYFSTKKSNNHKKLINNNSQKNIQKKEMKGEKNLNNMTRNKRINKRIVNLKKVKICLKDSIDLNHKYK